MRSVVECAAEAMSMPAGITATDICLRHPGSQPGLACF
jgi:hypothetical protein